MANTVRRWLVGHLEYLKLEELKKFKLFLLDYIPRGLLEGTDRTEVADVLVSYLGEQETWELALIIWAKMGLRELWERAWKDERNKYQERMRYKFRFMKEKNSRPGEYKLFHHRFTQLLLLQEYRYKEQKQHELLIHGWDHAEVMEEQGQLIDVSVLFDPVQETRVQPHTVMLQGPAGIGKTTLALKVMLDWAEGKLYQNKFNYVFFLSCRELNPLGEREISFADFIAHDWPGPQAPMTEIMSQPERLLFIIDGLDELKFPCNEHRYDLCKDWKQQRPVSILLSSLLRKIMLPEASLLLTSRLTALGKFSPLLENPRHVEILGFSVEHRKEYFCKFFRNDDLGKKAFNLVKGNATLFTMCYVPLMNWIVCTCLKQQEERGQDPIQTLKTTTALYMCYINLITPNDRNFVPQYLRGLCRLAAEGIWERKLLFEEEDLRRHGLEAADVSAFLDMNIFQKDVECENCYSFIHLSFQEFFAALFYMMRSDKERVERPDSSIPDVKKLLEEYNGNDASFVTLVVRFLFGFLNAETLRELERKFKFKMSPEIKSQLLRWVEGETKRNKIFSFSNSNLPEWYSHLYETQDAEFVTQALCDIQDIEVDFHYLYEALSAAFCIKHSPGIWRLDIAYVYDLPAYIWQDLFSVVNKNQNLKELKLSGFQLADTCLENLCVALRNPNCKLEKLTVDYFKTTYSCCQYLFSAHSLKSLHLESIFIEDDGMKLPWETLGEKKCQLQTLRIRHCKGFGVDFQDVFSFAIVNNESLKILDLYNNNLAEDEMKLLCDALAKENCKLQTLRLVCYNLMPTCFRNFFSALSSNKSLKNLYLMANCSADEGIQLLCKALGNTNCKLETLSPFRAAQKRGPYGVVHGFRPNFQGKFSQCLEPWMSCR
ncbi:NACHT, LRR and PYD domains-containing protein 12-like isoform X2 [Macrotis lagotis]|uniref:NACHT, LRR and PYD domains-containing protein 12-like isoform X2 n=1 Tax=Macrotis lagotis TaxID=92651 RepID=UPI003D6974CB